MKLTTLLVSIGVSIATTSQSLALSCTQDGFDLITTAKANQVAGNDVIYVLGQFKRISKLPKQKLPTVTNQSGKKVILLHPKKQKTTTATYQFNGKVFNPSGEITLKTKLKIIASCVGPWCGRPPTDAKTTIAILNKTKSGFSLNAGPCSPNTFSNNVKSDWRQLKQLIR